MAYGEFGGFLPREGTFSSPAAYTEAAKAEAFKSASYLAQMDQFFAQLSETSRQFNESLASGESQFARQLSESTRQFDSTFGLQKDQFEQSKVEFRETLDQNAYQFGETMDYKRDLMEMEEELSRAQMAQAAKAREMEVSYRSQELDLRGQELSLKADELSSSRDYRDRMTDAFMPYAEENKKLTNEALAQQNAERKLDYATIERSLSRDSYGAVGTGSSRGFEVGEMFIGSGSLSKADKSARATITRAGLDTSAYKGTYGGR